MTPLLYAVLAAVDGSRSHAEIASVVCDETGRRCSEDDIEFLVEQKLRPLGVLRGLDGSEPAVEKVHPLLALKWKFVVSSPASTRRLTQPFMWLFRPVVMAGFVAVFVALLGWLFFSHGLGASAHQALYEPEFLLLVFALTMVSAGFHEFGHAAACRYGGAQPGVMGAGLYLVWPAFYTDVTDSYRLSRGGRLRVDLGGLYFNAVFAVATFAVWAATGWEALLLVVVAQLVQMVRQLVPLVRLDGYHVLADLTGVPDLFAHVKPSRLFGRGASTLKPWARVVVTAWVLCVVPILLLTLVTIVAVLPRVAATAWDSLGRQRVALVANWAAADLPGVGVRILSILAISVPLLSMVYLVVRVVRRAVRRVWTATDSRPRLRGLALAFGLALLGFVLWSWLPKGQYEPIHATERGTIGDLATTVVSPGSAVLASASQEVAVAAPTSDAVAVPAADGAAAALGDAAVPASPVDAVLDDWPFPFNPPRVARDAGDNTALALNTQDGRTVFVLALSRIIIDSDDDLVDNRNDAYAFANCSNCNTIAVAFQLLILSAQHDVVVPQNVAVAVNYSCLRCTTLAFAVQLLVPIGGGPSDATLVALDTLWAQLSDLDEVSVEDLPARIEEVRTEILGVLQAAAPAGATTTTTTTAEASTTSSSDAGSSTTSASVETTTTTTEPPPESTTTSTEPPPESTTTTPPTTVP